MKQQPAKKLSLVKIKVASLSPAKQAYLQGGSETIETFNRTCKTWFTECGTGPFTIARTCVEG